MQCGTAFFDDQPMLKPRCTIASLERGAIGSGLSDFRESAATGPHSRANRHVRRAPREKAGKLPALAQGGATAPYRPMEKCGASVCRQFALHFTDYQRSSPHYGQLVNPANHLNCLPSPCSRLSRPRTTTEAPPACTSSGAHSLGIRADLPSPVHMLDSTHGRGCLSQSLSLLAASRREHHGLAARSP